MVAERIDPVAPELSIIVPVHNGARTLRGCLEALLSAPGPTRELIVVDDGSRDDSADLAASLGVCTLKYSDRRGCAAARNSGVRYTTAPILVFVDADVVIHPNALERISKFMSENRNYSAMFGSYDAEPADPGFVSQYRNLLHHFTHQSGRCEAETFWTGLGAVRRSDFQNMGGFRSVSPEDVELGLALSGAGLRIRLDRELLGKHLKTWNLKTMVSTDIFLRAVPWSELILKTGRITDDLNTSLLNRIGVALAMATVGFAALAAMIPTFGILAGLTLPATLAANTHVFKQFWKARGVIFTLSVIPLHFVHQLCGGAGFAIALKRYFFDSTWPLHDGRVIGRASDRRVT
jgi:cellulose synthase/poly-beta-1,6-N-acetylglucosamine synthase-like glycosyltransferase